jgi:hypothetical protein
MYVSLPSPAQQTSSIVSDEEGASYERADHPHPGGGACRCYDLIDIYMKYTTFSVSQRLSMTTGG